MLSQSFCQLPGVGYQTEQRLWQEGFDSWEKLLADLKTAPLGAADRGLVGNILEASIEALANGDYKFFAPALGLKESWRAFEHFRDKAVYLDIETDGGNSGNSVTIVGLFDGQEFTGLVKDRDLPSFIEQMERYSMVITFFGSGFDLPMLEKRFRGYRFEQIHLDLCPTLRRIDLRGGLKSIERQLGIARGGDTDGLTGYDAVKLWARYANLDDEAALERLIAYNREDVVNLERLAVYAYDKLKIATFLGTLAAHGERSSSSRQSRTWKSNGSSRGSNFGSAFRPHSPSTTTESAD